MSFRTHLIRKYRFDEMFRYYALFEDVDASFKIMQTHLLVGARRAKVYHYRAPQRRSGGLEMGMCQVLNRAYTVCNYSPVDSAARRRLTRYGYYKLLQYLLTVRSSYGRERVAGAWRAVRRIPQLLDATPDELPALYQRLREECLAARIE